MKCLKEIQGDCWAKMDNMSSEMKESLQKRPTPSMSLSFFCMAFGLCSVVWTHEAQGTKRARQGVASLSCPVHPGFFHTLQRAVLPHTESELPRESPSPSPLLHGPVTVETCLSLLVLLRQISQTRWLKQRGLSSVVKTPCFHCQGHRYNLWLGK